MMRSLYSGISGLSVHQTKMDVIGNNIANVNTVGFKASRVAFSDVFYQTVQSATGPNSATGAAGQNAMQIGLGSTVSSIVASPTKTGGAQRTDNPFDIMINGDSFFIVNQGGTNYFTKAGDFKIDADGTLCTSSGGTVMGWPDVDPKDLSKTIAGVVKPLKIMTPQNQYSAPQATTNAIVTGNIDSKDTQLAAGGSGATVNISFYDNLGESCNATFKLTQAAGATDEYNITLVSVTDSKGNNISPAATVTFGKDSYTIDPATGKITGPALGTTKIMFDPSKGTFDTAKSDNGGIPVLQLGGAVGTNPYSDVSIDFTTLTMYAGSGNTTLSSNMGDLNGLGKGRKAGNLTGLSVDTSGKIYGSYDNGDSRLLGQIAVASFSNPAGLESKGGNLFAETQNSGKFDGIGHDVTSDGGSFTTGVLEMSNVDLASEFTEMITTQRGFQANSRIITTSDTLLEELINLKR